MSIRKIKVSVPRWTTPVYIILTLILLPWTIYLGASLPTHHLSTHWDISWTGLDVGLVISMLATGIFAYAKSHWMIISSSTVGTLLIVDAWFDVMSERKTLQLEEAIILAVFAELPLAFISYYISFRALRSNI